MIVLKFIKEIEILGSVWTVTWSKKDDGGSFSSIKTNIIIGIKSYSIDPLYTISVLSHELMEIILLRLGARFENKRTEDNYLFNFDHQCFESAIMLHTQAITKFLK